MTAWLDANWGWLLASVICAVYFALYVVLARERRGTPHTGRARLEKDC